MKKFIALALALALLLSLAGCGGKAAAPFSGGTGTAEDPYQISTAADLRQLAKLTRDQNTSYEYYECHYLLTADIDLENKAFDALFSVTGFRGVFDGGGHTISGLNIHYKKPLSGKSVKDQGLFSMAWDAQFRNLTISGSSFAVDADSGCIGAIVGSASSCSFENCHVTGSVTVLSNYHAGGLAGTANKGTFTDCTNAAAVTAQGSVATAGGLAAHSSAVITGCSNSGPITAGSNAGGLAAVQNATVEDSHNSGPITADQNYAGGIAATFGDGALNQRENDETVSLARCTNTASVTSGAGDAGGITAAASTGAIVDCENSGDVTGNILAGGIVARFQESAFGTLASRFTVEGCVNSGAVRALIQEPVCYAGGIGGWFTASAAQITVRGCENRGDVSSVHYAGGMLGSFTGPWLELDRCTNSGALEGQEVCGGMLGEGSPTGEKSCEIWVTGCVNSGDLYVNRYRGFGGFLMDSYAGGMVGRISRLENQQEVQLTVEGCENTGALEGEDMYEHFFADPGCASWGK